MSSDTDTDTSSSCSEEEVKRHKSSKKRKHKSEKKKHSKSKKKKKSKKHDDIQKTIREKSDAFSFGPALPPHLLQKRQEPVSTVSKTIIGPTIPQEFLCPNNEDKIIATNVEEKDANYDGYGPVPTNTELTGTQLELEQRALELKLAAIEGRNLQPIDTKIREEWMLELPKVGLPTGLAALTNMKRTFHQGKERPDFSDR